MKALRVGDPSLLLSLPVERLWLGFHVKQWLLSSDSVGEAGSLRRVPVHCAAVRHSRTPEAVLQGAAWASSGVRPTEQLSESPGAAHFRGQDFSNSPAVLCVDTREFKHTALLLQLPQKGFSEVSWKCLPVYRFIFTWLMYVGEVKRSQASRSVLYWHNWYLAKSFLKKKFHCSLYWLCFKEQLLSELIWPPQWNIVSLKVERLFYLQFLS